MKDSIIQFHNLSKSYPSGFLGRRNLAVRDLSFAVPAGSIYGFLGANGAGKTTCIKVLMGLQFAEQGSVKVFGLDPLDPEAKRRIGYLPERPYFHDAMSAGDFLNFHRRLFGTLPANRAQRTNEELLRLVGLGDVGTKPLRSFSKGMLQRAGIAQALVNDPDLVVLDEPMSGLDPVGRREMRDLILQLHALGKTVFFSSHILSDVEEICHRIAFLEKGVLRHEADLREILHPEEGGFELTFVGNTLDALAERRKARRVNGLVVLEGVSATDVKPVIEEFWAAGGTLLSCQRRHRNLEDFLFGHQDQKDRSQA